jgi:hypothetical protein
MKQTTIKEGNFFEKALKIIETKYEDKVKSLRPEIFLILHHSYNKAHILLDQTYAYDQGYNALEAMARGGFTGRNILRSIITNRKIAINAIADVDYLVNELSF